MASEWKLPQNLEDVWQLTRDKFAARDAAHLDATLVQIGNDVLRSTSRPEDAFGVDQMVWDAWHGASTVDRQRLAALFMRTVGHHEFLDEDD